MQARSFLKFFLAFSAARCYPEDRIVYTKYQEEAAEVMDYLLTWIKGEEVDYRFVSADELEKLLANEEEEKNNCIVVPLH